LHLLFFLPLNWILHLLFLPHLLKVLITTQNDILIILIEFILHLLLEWSNFIIKGIIILLFVLILKLVLISLYEHVLLIILLHHLLLLYC